MRITIWRHTYHVLRDMRHTYHVVQRHNGYDIIDFYRLRVALQKHKRVSQSRDTQYMIRVSQSRDTKIINTALRDTHSVLRDTKNVKEMKKYILMLVASLFMFSAQAQKFGYVDSEYILKKIPAYKSAQDQLERMTKQNEQEVEAKYKEVDDLFKKYQSEKVLLTDDMRQKREADIVAKEREVKEMQKKYFSPEGSVAKKRDELLKPIQDRVFTAVKELATDGGYATIFDVSNNPGIIYNNPRFDLSDKILEKMGHKN